MNDIQITQRRFFDWRMNLSLGLLVMVLLLVGAYVNNAHEMNVKDQQQAASARQIDVLTSEVKTLIAAQNISNADASAERARLLADLHSVLVFEAKSGGRLTAVLTYLRRHGIKLPARLLTAIAPPRFERISGSSSTSTRSAKKKSRPPKR